MRRFSGTILAVVLATGYAGPVARAQRLTPPPLVTEACLAGYTLSLQQALALELRNRMRAAARTETSPPRFVLGCEGPLILIRVFAGRDGRILERTVDVSSTPPAARSRLMAVAASELGDSLWGIPEQSPPATVPAVTSAGQPAALVSAAPRISAPPPILATAALRLSVMGDLRAFTGAVGLLPGLALGATRRWKNGAGAMVDLVLNGATRQLALGRGAVALLSSRPAATATMDWHRLTFSVGAGARLGVARLTGIPNSADVAGSTIWGLWGGPSLSASATWSPWPRGTFSLLVEGGWTLAQVVGRQAGASALSVAGPWTAIQLGVGWP